MNMNIYFIGKMAGGCNHRHPPRHMRQTQIRQHIPLVIGEQKLFGIIGENTNRIHALIDHAIKHTPHALQIQIAIGEKRRWRNRKNTF
jgi:hypothetical protein